MRLTMLLALLLSFGLVHANNYTNSAGEWYFWSDGTRIYARTLGNGESDPVVVVHGGFGAEHSYLLPALESLLDERQFVLFDQRGSLRSPAEDDSVSISSFVEDLEQLRKELRLEKLQILSHSMGAVTAYAYLAKYPQNVKKIVLVSPVFPFYPGITPDKEMLEQLGLPTDEQSPSVKQLIAGLSAQQERFDLNAKEQLKREGLDGPALNSMQRTAQWLIHFASVNIFDITKWRQMLGGQAFFNDRVYPNVVKNAGGDIGYRKSWSPYFPALVENSDKLAFIVGRNDFIDGSYMYWPLILDQLPRAHVTAIDHAGHNIWIDQPSAFKAAVREAL